MHLYITKFKHFTATNWHPFIATWYCAWSHRPNLLLRKRPYNDSKIRLSLQRQLFLLILLSTRGILLKRMSEPQRKNYKMMTENLSVIWSGALIGQHSSNFLAVFLWMTDKDIWMPNNVVLSSYNKLPVNIFNE